MPVSRRVSFNLTPSTFESPLVSYQKVSVCEMEYARALTYALDVAHNQSKLSTTILPQTVLEDSSTLVPTHQQRATSPEEDPTPAAIFAAVAALVERKQQLNGLSLRQLIDVQGQLNGVLHDVTQAMSQFANDA